MIVGGLLSDCVYGRIPLMVWSFLVYVCSIVVFLLIISFCSPSFFLIFAISLFIDRILIRRIISSVLYGIVLASSFTLTLNYEYISSPTRKLNVLKAVIRAVLFFVVSSLIVRSFLFWCPFVTSFRILSILAIIFLCLTVTMDFVFYF